MKRWAMPVALIALVAVLAGPALAGGKIAPTGSLSFGGAGLASTASATFAKGDVVQVTASYSGVRKQDLVKVQVLCMQDVGVVYGDAVTLSGSPQTVSFTLGTNSSTATSVWTTGAARCRADLYYLTNVSGGNAIYLANLTFSATA